MTFPGVWRIPVKVALAFVAFVALGCAALHSASTLWAQIIATLTFTALLIAIVGSYESADRSFWRGFAVFGWAYLFLSSGPWCVEHVRPVLLSHRLLEEVYAATAADRGVMISLALDSGPFEGSMPFSIWNPDYVRFHSIGHNVFCLAHALFGGFVGRFFALRRQAHQARTTPSTQPARAVDVDDETTRN